MRPGAGIRESRPGGSRRYASGRPVERHHLLDRQQRQAGRLRLHRAARVCEQPDTGTEHTRRHRQEDRGCAERRSPATQAGRRRAAQGGGTGTPRPAQARPGVAQLVHQRARDRRAPRP